MAAGDLNRLTIIGRLTADPEPKDFSNGGRVAKFRMAFTGSTKKNADDEYEDTPCFLGCQAFNPGGQGKGQKLADLVMKFLKKGHRVYLEGRLQLETWEKDGQKRSEHKLTVEKLILLEGRKDAGGAGDENEDDGRGDSRSVRVPAGGRGGGRPAERGRPPADDEDDGIPF